MPKSRWPLTLAAALLLVAVLAPAVRVSAAAVTISAQPVRTGLTAPVSFTFAPDGRIFYGERTTGRIASFDPGNSAAPVTYFTIADVVSPGEQGLLGLALDPNFASNHLMYAYVTRLVANQHMNEIVRIFGDGVTGAYFTVLYRAPAGGAYHNGGRLKFGPDGLLYVVTGDIHDSSNSQNLTDNLGKILRMTRAGAVPPQGNPVAGTLIYAYGIRNSFGFSFDPTTGNLWESENGPACNDEINLITAGGNYGWGPAETCATPPAAPTDTNQDGPAPVRPKRFFTPTIAPTGLAFCSSCGLGPSTEGAVLFGAFNTSDLWRLTLDTGRTAVKGQSVIYHHSSSILSLERSSGGALYLSDASGIYRLTAA
jgi:glucose/arabinose dehydrogenase